MVQGQSLQEVASHVVSLGIAFAFAFPIGWDREHFERTAGIRTFPLVAMASCGFVLIAVRIVGVADASQARILEGLITGIGFIGGGAILKRDSRSSGTATATSLWATGMVGAAVGYGLYDIAAIMAAATFATLRWMGRFKSRTEEAISPEPAAPIDKTSAAR